MRARRLRRRIHGRTQTEQWVIAACRAAVELHSRVVISRSDKRDVRYTVDLLSRTFRQAKKRLGTYRMLFLLRVADRHQLGEVAEMTVAVRARRGRVWWQWHMGPEHYAADLMEVWPIDGEWRRLDATNPIVVFVDEAMHDGIGKLAKISKNF